MDTDIFQNFQEWRLGTAVTHEKLYDVFCNMKIYIHYDIPL